MVCRIIAMPNLGWQRKSWALSYRQTWRTLTTVSDGERLIPAFNNQRHLEEVFQTAINSLGAPAKDIRASISTARPLAKTALADYQCTNAFHLSKALRRKPIDIAKDLVERIPLGVESGIASLDLSGAGFINITLRNDWIAGRIKDIAQYDLTPGQHQKHKKRILIDFASPNMGKELHVGHLRSSVIGDCLARLMEFKGHEVARISHVGDMGAAICSTIQYLLELSPQPRFVTATKEEVEADQTLLPTTQQLGTYYEEAKRRAKGDPQFARRISDAVLRLQKWDKNDHEIRNLWWVICEASRRSYGKLFKRLHVSVKERGEATYRDVIPKVLQELEASSLLVPSEGAKVVFLEDRDGAEVNDEKSELPPILLEKKDGGYLYATTDAAALRQRLVEDQYDWLVYITDNSQSIHFTQLFKLGRMAGWVHPHQRIDHISFGLVTGEDGKKLSSRKGVPVTLGNLLDEVVQAAGEVAAKTQVGMAALSETEKQEIAEAVGIGSVRYFELSHHRDRNYQFSLDRVFAVKGNTAVYAMYARTRLQSVLAKCRQTSPSITWEGALDKLKVGAAAEWEPEERLLCLRLTQLQEALDGVEQSLNPLMLCEYIFGLSTAFHSFYEHCKVLGHPREEQRLAICAATRAVLETCLSIVGVQVIDRM